MKRVLMVAEKPSLAASIAGILSNRKYETRKGFSHCLVHEWQGEFMSRPVTFSMTYVCGHVMELDFIEKYNNWDRFDPIELFSCPTKKKEKDPKMRLPQFLAEEARGCDYLVLWLDCDKEGEHICFEVINAIQGDRPRFSPEAIYRARFSAISDKDIKAAMNNLVRPNENEAKSVEARLEVDLRIGCAFTRFQTKFFQEKYSDLDASCISYGPCQTPTLGFCVQRHDEIQTFKPEQYWVLQVNIRTLEGIEATLNWNRIRCFDKDVATIILNSIKEEPTARVTEITEKSKSKTRPIALNTVELMKIGSSGLNMSPHSMMQVAEKLYIQGYISYPRTETTQYPKNFDFGGTLKFLAKNPEWGEDVNVLLKDGFNIPTKGHDAGDHPPITPMKFASSKDLDHEMWKVYDYVCRHFIATVSRDCKYVTKTMTFMVGEESFNTVGKTVTSLGYTAVMPWQAISKTELLPDFEEGQEVPIQDVKMVDCQTNPPDYLTESELISLMEKHSIGTDASIPSHINNICNRNYVRVISGRKLEPLMLGIVLVHGYQKIDPELVLPTMRSEVEKQLNLIARGQADFNQVLDHTIEVFKLKYLYFVKNIEGMDQLFEVNFSSLASSGKALSRCGKCRRYMKYIQFKPPRLHCSHCNETYNLPSNGNIRQFKELKCPLDDFELLSWSTGARGKSFPLCPYCYNHPPFLDMKKGNGCNACTHPNCPHSFNSNGISACAECGGVLVLDPASGPKWKMGCSKCDVIIHLFEDAQRVKVEENRCDCGAQLLTVEYKQEKTKLSNGETEMSGCIFCLSAFIELVEKGHAVASRPATTNKPSRGRGKSRGKGKPRQPKDRMTHLATFFV